MLNDFQRKYLEKISDEKIARVGLFDPETQNTAKEIENEIISDFPGVQVFYIGSSALGIAGENDIDMSIVAPKVFEVCFAAFKSKYGEPQHLNLIDGYAHWEFIRNSFPVELHLNNRLKPYLQEQLNTQKIFEQDANVRNEYEQMKLRCNGIPWREYMRQKYEFWNRMLGQ